MELKNINRKYVLIGIGVVLSIAFMVIPKPELIRYKSANIVSEAIYWDGLGRSGTLSDADASFIKLDYETNHLHICYGLDENEYEINPSSCQEYNVIENRGFSGAISKMLK